MRENFDIIIAYTIMLGLIVLVGFLQSWSMALSILCFCLISAVMTIGANIQWGYAGLINFGIMGYTALGGLAAVLEHLLEQFAQQQNPLMLEVGFSSTGKVTGTITQEQ